MTKRFGVLCVALALAGLAAPAGAQQTPPTETSVPPAPPPELPPPPPFPPMPSARPSHRWVETGQHRARHHATSSARQKARASQHRGGRHHEQPTSSPAAKVMRRCAGMSAHRMLHDRVCSAMVQAYHQAVKPSHHKARHHPTQHRHRRR